MTSKSFTSRMAELDAIVEKCVGKGAFAVGVVRDASNRTNRDWRWWGVQIEQTNVDGSESRRATATITLRSTQAGEPGSFDAQWRAQVWQGVGQDTFRQEGTRELDWQLPTPELLRNEMGALLDKARSAILSRTRT